MRKMVRIVKGGLGQGVKQKLWVALKRDI